MPAAALFTLSLTPELLAVVFAALVLAIMAALGSRELGDARPDPAKAGRQDGASLSQP